MCCCKVQYQFARQLFVNLKHVKLWHFINNFSGYSRSKKLVGAKSLYIHDVILFCNVLLQNLGATCICLNQVVLLGFMHFPFNLAIFMYNFNIFTIQQLL